VERLVQISEGSDRILVGISGFGSANVGEDRWRSLADLTGFTTFMLQYDAQEFPLYEKSSLGLPSSAWISEVSNRWSLARKGAYDSARYLARWVRRWFSSDKHVILVGFSLGAFIAWNVAQMAGNRGLDLVLICGGVGASREMWDGLLPRIGDVVNMYSKKDFMLSNVYPYGVSLDELPALGISRIPVESKSKVDIDITDLIDGDHLLASARATDLARVGLAILISRKSLILGSSGSIDFLGGLDESVRERMWRWVFIDLDLMIDFWNALMGRAESVRRFVILDEWILASGRFSTLAGAGRSAMILKGITDEDRDAFSSSVRGLLVLRGLIRFWLQDVLLSCKSKDASAIDLARSSAS
jgi:pimeloyl-ACP methyl ester carboxylesterase